MPQPAPSFSFEFFPPKSEKGAAELELAARQLAALNPSCMTVTYGAGGSSREGTFATVTRLARLTAVPMGCHLTFCGTTKDELWPFVDKLWENGIRHIVALRGDLPPGKSMADFTGDEYFHYTSDFVEALLRRHPFEISVGAYPEKHPDAPSIALDIEALRKKCAAGATRAITQFFFDNNIYYDFLEDIAKVGITTPVIPGLLPVGDFARMQKFAKTCNASVPVQLHRLFEKAGEDADATARIGAEFLALQIEDLIKNGVPHIHFYTLNRADICLASCKSAGLAV